VADVELFDFGDGGDRRDVPGGESVTCMNREAEAVAVAGRGLERAKDCRIIRMVGVLARVQLNSDGAKVARRETISMSGSMKRLVRTPIAASCSIADRSAFGSRVTSSPPSVVTSSRRSGTNVT
jgi:hypothetical protein